MREDDHVVAEVVAGRIHALRSFSLGQFTIRVRQLREVPVLEEAEVGVEVDCL